MKTSSHMYIYPDNVCISFDLFHWKMMKGATEKQRLAWMLPLDLDFAWLPHADKNLEGKYQI